MARKIFEKERVEHLAYLQRHEGLGGTVFKENVDGKRLWELKLTGIKLEKNLLEWLLKPGDRQKAERVSGKSSDAPSTLG